MRRRFAVTPAAGFMALAVLALCPAELAAEAPSTDDKRLLVRDLPLHYRALFEVGRAFRYRVKHVISDDEVDHVTFQGLATCVVVSVSSPGDSLRTIIECSYAPSEPEGYNGVSTTHLVAGTWIATAAGIQRERPDATAGAPVVLAARPKKLRIEKEEKEGGEARGVEQTRGAWCAYEADWGGDQGEVRRCFNARGIARAHRQEAGGTFFEASLELLQPATRQN